MSKKQARRWLRKNGWNLAPTKLETFSDSKQKNMIKMQKRCKEVLEWK